jgi:hypothetical protein
MNATRRPARRPATDFDGANIAARSAASPWRADAVAWFEAAQELERECAELRRIATSLFFWIAEHEDLLAFAKAEADRRWPSRKAA